MAVAEDSAALAALRVVNATQNVASATRTLVIAATRVAVSFPSPQLEHVRLIASTTRTEASVCGQPDGLVDCFACEGLAGCRRDTQTTASDDDRGKRRRPWRRRRATPRRG